MKPVQPSLHYRMIVSYVLATLLPIVIIGLIIIGLLTRQSVATVNRRNLDLARSLSTQISVSIESHNAVLEHLAKTIMRKGSDIPAWGVQTYLNSFKSLFPAFQAIYLLDQNGIITQAVPTRFDILGASAALEPIILEATKTQKRQLQFSTSKIFSPRPEVLIAIPSQMGVVLGVLDINELTQRIHEINLGRKRMMVLYDKQGSVVVHSKTGYTSALLNLTQLPKFTEVNDKAYETFYFNDPERKWVAASSLIPMLGWHLVVMQPVREAFSSLWIIGKTLLIVLVVGILLTSLYGWLVVKRIMKPMEQMSDSFQQIAAGNYDTVIEPTKIYKEFIPLVDGLQSMVTAIDQREQALSQSLETIRQRERAVVESEEYLKTVLNSMLVGIMVVDIQTHRIVDVNSFASTMIGMSKSDIIGHDCRDFFFPKGQCRCEVDFHSRQAVGSEHTLLGAGGKAIPVLKTVYPLERKGKKFVLESIVDLSELKKARIEVEAVNRELEERNRELWLAIEQAERLARDAQAANKAKTEFLANISHEIRTPINGILGMTELVLETDLSPEQREYLEIVRESTETLLWQVNKILDLSKMESGVLELEMGTFKLREMLATTVEDHVAEAYDKGLELIHYVHPDVPETLIGDAGRLRQILKNLIGNAVKFTQAGEVVIRVAKESQRGDLVFLHFAIADTGIGIPKDQQESIFDPFVQVDASSTREYGGTGLGLAITKMLVEIMGGKVWFESEPGKGSVFHFTIRFGLQDDKATWAYDRIEKLEGASVLVVDDNATVRRMLEGLLRQWGMNAGGASSGQEALRLLWERQQRGDGFPLVIIDAVMPDMDGFTTAERILTEFPTAADSSKIIILVPKQYSENIPDHPGMSLKRVTKPVNPADLLQAIQELVTSSKEQAEISPTIPTDVTIPAEKRTKEIVAGRDSAKVETVADNKGMSILVAEDNPVNRKLIVRILEKEGHRVTAVENGKLAVETIKKQDFDVILMDVQMPVMDGLTATAAIRELEKKSGKHIPIIALTAHAMKGDREQCLEAGMDDYMTKPIRKKTVVEYLEKWSTQRS